MKEKFVKNRFIGIVTFVTCIIILFMATLVVTSCDHRSERKQQIRTERRKDSVYIARTIDKALNPTFDNVQEICKYKERSAEESCTDSIFIHMPYETFINVATVVYNRDGSLTKNAVITEYLHGKTIYDNLQRKQLREDYAYEKHTVDTIIDGKHFQLIKEGVTNAK